MTYQKQSWTNGSGGQTPINSTRLSHIEDGIAANDMAVTSKAEQSYVDDRLATKANASSLAGKADVGHTHTASSITDFVAAAVAAGFLRASDFDDVSSTYATTAALNTAIQRITALENNATSGGGGGTTPVVTTTRPATPTTTAQPTWWLRSDAITGVSSGGAVSTWSSSTGAGDATVSTLNGGTAPTLLTGALNGRPAVRFLKSAVSKMKFGTATGATAKDHTFLVVARHPVIANAGFLIHGFNGTSGVDAAATMAIRAQVTTAGVFTLGAFGATGGSASATAAGAVTANTWNLFSIDFTTGAAPTATLNGVSAAAGAGSTDAAGTLTAVALGGYGSGSSDVDIVEILYWPNQIDTTTRKTWEQYLATTHALTVAA